MKRDLIFSFDVGHSSIGWNVLQVLADKPNELALGDVKFKPNTCLASESRTNRQQRRSTRALRQRVEGIEKLFIHQKIITPKQVERKHKQAGGHAAPWLLAATSLATNGAFKLSGEELFDVVRWYAHNRGYDGNRSWARNIEVDKELEQEDIAIELMDTHKTSTMAETICAELGVKSGGKRCASEKSYKNMNVAFPRHIVVFEVEKILRHNLDNITGCTEKFIETLCGQPDKPDAWEKIKVEGLYRSKTFQGGILFGQKIPRFDNRILSICPITNKPTPLKAAKEYTEFRCAMFLVNVRVKDSERSDMRPLNAQERNAVWQRVNERGYLTADQFKKTVRSQGNYVQDDLEGQLILKESENNFVIDPPKKLIHSNNVLKLVWPTLPEDVQKEFWFQINKKRSITLGQIEAFMGDEVPNEFRDAVQKAFDKDKSARKEHGTLERWMERKTYCASFDAGRAPYGRDVMRKAVSEVLAGNDPNAKEGCLYITEEIRQNIENKQIDKLTNNHLVRHRLLILNRLLDAMLAEFADGDKERIKTVVVEVNREVSEMSGKTIKEIEKEERSKRADHKKAKEKLEKAIKESGENITITAGLIRKARIAGDLDWRCPYTGKEYDPMDLIYKHVDVDHIIPRSERLSDSMAGLVVTFSEVNRMKGKRTGWQFIQDEQGKPVSGMPQLTILSPDAYKTFIDRLNIKGSSNEDQVRRKKRKKYLLMPSYEDKDFTSRDLTISSHVTKLAVQQIKNTFRNCTKKPQVVSLPGRLTGEARKTWKLMGLLSVVNENITEEVAKDKQKVRSLTHLHHAVDAATMGLLAYYVKDLSDGATWKLLIKRYLRDAEIRQLEEKLDHFHVDSKNKAHLDDIPKSVKNQLRKRLAERRVVQHIASSMDGLHVKQNTLGVVGTNEKTGLVQLRNEANEISPLKLLGYKCDGYSKLQQQKGVRMISENFGVALCEPEPEIIPWHKVYPRLQKIAVRIGKWPVVLRNGMVIHVPEGTYAGVWRVFSIKNNAKGLALDIGYLDGIKPNKRNTLLKTFINNGLKIISTTLTGDGICHITSSTSTAHPSD